MMRFKYLVAAFLAVTAVVGERSVRADDEARNGYHWRWDFSCKFHEDERCMAFASVFTNIRPHGDSARDVEVLNGQYNRMAIFCRDDGVVYANGASLRVSEEHVTVAAPGMNRPRIVMEHDHHDLTREDGVRSHLFLSSGRPLDGRCRIHAEHVR